MAPAPRKTAAAAAVVLLVLLTAVPSESFVGGCNPRLSGSYRGVCFPPFNDNDCRNACVNESSDNLGRCFLFQCWCYTPCGSKIVAAPAGAPMIQP